MTHPSVCPRIALQSARQERLLFAQVREDPQLEIDALRPQRDRRYAIVSSGGCSALSLVARGAGSVVAVDLNSAQNHLVELKAAALARLDHRRMLAFLGAANLDAAGRREIYRSLRPSLSEPARQYWDERGAALEKGVLGAGVTEKFIRVVIAAVRILIHPRSRMNRLLACSNLEDQVRFFEEEWNTWRWRLLFAVMVNRRAFNRTYSPDFFRYADTPSFSRHFQRLIERTLRELPVRDNYFLHHMIAGRYPVETPGGLPPYMEAAAQPVWSEISDRLTLVDGTFTDFLCSQPIASFDGFSLSNICEWLDAVQLDNLFAEILRTARPGAVLCFRNFVGWTKIPARFAAAFPLEPAEEDWIRRDRSLMQRRFARCRIRKEMA